MESGFGKGTPQWHDIRWVNLNKISTLMIMGFADLSISEIAEDYHLSIEEVCALCDRLGVAYKAPQTRLALEDVKALILEILANKENT